MSKNKRVAILFGGRSAEHEISLISAINIIKALDRERFTPTLIGLDKQGAWFLQDEEAFLAQEQNPKTVKLQDKSRPLTLLPGLKGPHIYNLKTGLPIPEPDVIFPILHGPNGEDGTIQGLLRQINLPFVGPDVLSSAAAMDKDIAKRLMTHAGIPNAPFRTFNLSEKAQINFADLVSDLKLPLFVKPANMGSSVGISRVENAKELLAAINLAFAHDVKIIIEEGLKGREIECAILGNESPKASPIGEIVPQDGFYDYEAKYIDAKSAALLLPAPDMDPATIARVQALAIKTHQVLECTGLSRVDFFLSPEGELFVNEVNTLPGFTKISMYPSLWELGGVEYSDLINQLLDLAIQRKAVFDKLG